MPVAVQMQQKNMLATVGQQLRSLFAALPQQLSLPRVAAAQASPATNAAAAVEQGAATCVPAACNSDERTQRQQW